MRELEYINRIQDILDADQLGLPMRALPAATVIEDQIDLW